MPWTVRQGPFTRSSFRPAIRKRDKLVGGERLLPELDDVHAAFAAGGRRGLIAEPSGPVRDGVELGVLQRQESLFNAH